MAALPAKYILEKKNGQFIYFGPLILGNRNEDTPLNFILDATGTANLKDPVGAPVPPIQDLNFTLFDRKTGVYRAFVDATFDPAEGGGYNLIVEFSTPRGDFGHWEIPTTVVRRHQN